MNWKWGTAIATGLLAFGPIDRPYAQDAFRPGPVFVADRPPSSSFPTDVARDRHGNAMDRVETLLQESASMRRQRLEELREHLNALRELAATTAQHSSTPESEPIGTPSASGSPAESGLDPSGRDPFGTSAPPVPPAAGSSGPEASSPDFAAGPPNTATLTSSPIDRLSLANNLLAAGQFDLALESYKQLEVDKLSDSEKRWARFQMAGCYRRLGATSQAEQIYRELAGDAEGSVTAEQSRWWLDRIQRRQRLEDSVKGLADAVASLKEQIDGQTSK